VEIVREIWRAVGELGFAGGRVLEPGAGAGVFIGLAPARAEITAVELDPTTAAIARALYPHATVRAESFATSRLPDGHFDLSIGNVPFADVVLHDPVHNRGRHSIHNHFIVKSLALTRPGGLVAVLTSRYTLDAANPAARREMNDLGELLGAVRLPTGAHRRAAGTDAVTDLLILRRRDGLTVKRVEKAVLVGEQRLQERLDNPKDLGVCFEQTGIDYLFVDEAHQYKNLHTASNIRDAAIDGSKRASDLHMKIEYLRARHGERVATMATATPIANSITEAHVMQRYLRPDLLAAAGVEDFDAWAATFGELVTEIEMAPTGGGSYRMHTRFARFQNVPEMLRMWHLFADVKTPEDLFRGSEESTGWSGLTRLAGDWCVFSAGRCCGRIGSVRWRWEGHSRAGEGTVARRGLRRDPGSSAWRSRVLERPRRRV
jgi:hypothetical protein